MGQKPPKINDEMSYQNSGLYHEAGTLEFKQNSEKDANGSSIPNDRSYVLLKHKFGSLLQFIGGNVVLKAVSDLGFESKRNMFFNVGADVQWSVEHDYHEYIKGDRTHQTGKISKKQRDAAKELQRLTGEIDKEKISKIESTEGEEIPCHICEQELLSERGSNLVSRIFRTVEKYVFPNWPYPLQVIEKWIDFLVVPFISSRSNLSMSGGKGCDSPYCKNGKIKSPKTSLDAGNEAAAAAYEARKEQIADAQKRMESGGAQVIELAGDAILRVGLERNDAPTVATVDGGADATRLTTSEDRQDLMRLSSKGTPKTTIHSDPLINAGSLMVDISNKLTVISGSPGIEMHTSGKMILDGAVTTIHASQGELTLTSANKTTLKGKSILIDAKDRTGDTGVKIDSDSTMVAGLLSVTGDLALKGSLIMDGGCFCTHLTCPTERLDSGPAGSAHQVHSGATWNVVGAGEATIYDTYDKVYKAASRDIYNVLSLNILNLSEIKTLIEETYSTLMLAMPFDNNGIPTGVAYAGNYPLGVPPLQVVVWGLAGPSYGYVIPGQLLPVYNFTHIHNSPGQNHSHATTVPTMDGWGDAASARQARPTPSHVPTPARTKGMGTPPGHKHYGYACGGGGGAFVGGQDNRNKRVKDAILARNQRYGINGLDAFNGTNYVNTTPLSGNYSFNPDGTLNPLPNFTGLQC